MTASTLALSDLSLDTGVPTESDRQQLLSEVAEYFAHGAVVKPGAVVFDVGANVGAFALLAAKQAQGNVSLHCFEPAPQNLQLLDKNLRSNKWLANTHTKIAAMALTSAADAGKTIPLFFFKRNSRDTTIDLAAKHADFEQFFRALGERLGKSTSRVLGKWIGSLITSFIAWIPKGWLGAKLADMAMGMVRTECKTESLEGYCKQNGIAHIDLLKIDVESAELSVLSGVGAMWPHISQVVVEATDRDGRIAEVTAILTAQGFTIGAVAPTADSAHTGIPNRLVVTKPR